MAMHNLANCERAIDNFAQSAIQSLSGRHLRQIRFQYHVEMQQICNTQAHGAVKDVCADVQQDHCGLGGSIAARLMHERIQQTETVHGVAA